ncbi:hypothetical protein [Thiomicrorhabdus sediminis]|uniref:DUF4398 domain-containing protein n=1 Tax=Thiomicrorhabdus sediminis TaxID=2580412 RepID=A0A4P9K5Z6_9GAMM|nr:hypothetical protein [Thiomicrorhabdus sediminis]QCU89706.1 hypothetical protein FE785_03155 [Thiomicrorhabdus sediminis]
MKKLFIGTALVAALSMGACTSNTANPTTYDDYVEAAVATHAKAKAMGDVWKQKKMKLPYVEHYLAEADKAKKAGDDAKALKLAKEAYKTANAEVAQAETVQKAAWEK